MKRRSINYLRRLKAIKTIEHPRESSLKSLLASAMELCDSRVVKRHIQSTLQELQGPKWAA